MRASRLPFPIVAIVIVDLMALTLSAAPPQISQLAPLALCPGKTIELRFHGQNLRDPRRLWTSFASRSEFVASDDESSQKGESLLCRVTVPRDEQVGTGAIRLVTGEGVSNPVLMMLDDLPTAAESSDNGALAQAQSLPWPIAIDGQYDAVQEDFFRLHAAAGQRVVFEVVSQRLGFKLDPVLQLFRPDGTVVERVDDAEGAGGDCRFAHTFDTAGEYIVTLRDVRYAGGGEFRYRLRVGAFPLVTSAYPAGGRSGEVVSFALVDKDGTTSLVHVRMPNAPNRARVATFSVPGRPDMGSGWFQAEANSGSESLEVEPNDGSDTATVAAFPGALNGRLDKAGDRDCFKFQAKKGQRIHCVAITRELGSPCDLYMTLHKRDGTQIAEARQERRTTLDAEVAEDGEYVLQIENLLMGDAANHVYRVKISDEFHGFSLHAEQMQYNAPHAGTFVVKVLAQRAGYNGPIELGVNGLGDGVVLEGHKIEGPETLLKITLPPDIPPGEMRHASIVGKATVGERVQEVAGSQRDILTAAFPNVLSFPTELENSIAIGIGPAFPPFFDLSLQRSDVYFPQIVGASTFDINVARTHDAFKEAISLSVEGLPPGLTSSISPVDDGSKAYRVSLSGPPDIPEGTFPIRIVGVGKFQEQSQTVKLENVILHVTRPLVVSLTMSGPIVQGGAQTAAIQLQRFGEPKPVRLQINDGPAGLSAPIFVAVPSEVSEVTIPFTAAADATPGRYTNLVINASTNVKGQDIAVQSRPAVIEILPATAE
jgi:hypothetical protein